MKRFLIAPVSACSLFAIAGAFAAEPPSSVPIPMPRAVEDKFNGMPAPTPLSAPQVPISGSPYSVDQSSMFEGECCTLPAWPPRYWVPPPMIGDWFYGGLDGRLGIRGNTTVLNGTISEPGGFSRYSRISENTSPIPMDRAFVNYNYFKSVLNGVDVHQGVVGFEKTFLRDTFSLQVNVPISRSLDSTQFISTGASDTDFEFGNISLWLKFLAIRTQRLAVSTGVGINTPTADDISLFTTQNSTTPLLAIRNETVKVIPFVGAVFTPTPDTFVQSFTQFDYDTVGNPIEVAGNTVGRMSSAVLFSTGLGAGFVAYRSCDPCAKLTSFVPMAELHYTTNIGNSTSFQTNNAEIISRTNEVNALNANLGASVGLGYNTKLNIGAGMPVLNNGDESFEWQAFAQLNYAFGGR